MSATARVSFGDLATSARFLARLPSFLRNPMDLEGARELVARRLERRAEDFIETLRVVVFRRPDSPTRSCCATRGASPATSSISCGARASRARSTRSTAPVSI